MYLKKMQKFGIQENGGREASWKEDFSLIHFFFIGKIINRIESFTGMNDRTGRVGGSLQIMAPCSTSLLYLNECVPHELSC